MNALTHMAQTLTREAPMTSTLPQIRSKTNTRAGKMRVALESGPKTSQELAAIANIRTSLVSALLKYDMIRGRIELVDGRYQRTTTYDEELANEIERATKLLQRHGYTVTKITG